MKRAPSAPVPAAVRALLRRWRAQHPLRSGSLLVTIFGDAIAPRGAAVTLGSLIRLAAPFGLTERLVRTSVARLARQGCPPTRRQPTPPRQPRDRVTHQHRKRKPPNSSHQTISNAVVCLTTTR